MRKKIQCVAIDSTEGPGMLSLSVFDVDKIKNDSSSDGRVLTQVMHQDDLSGRLEELKTTYGEVDFDFSDKRKAIK